MYRELKDTLYRLKRDYGISASIYKLVQAQMNYETGAKVPTRTIYHIRKLILLPLETKVLVNTNILPADFKYGGGFEIGDRECLIDRRDLPGDVDRNDYVVFAAKRYNIQKILDLDGQMGYYLHLRETQDQLPYQQAEGVFWEHVFFVESFAGEI